MRAAAHARFHVSDVHRLLRVTLVAMMLAAPLVGPSLVGARVSESGRSSPSRDAPVNGGRGDAAEPFSTSKAPVAAFSLSPRNGPLPLKVSFNAGAAKAASGRTIASFTWDFGDGTPKKSGMKTSHTFTTAKLRTVKLTVVDSAGASGSVTHTVDAGNTAPTPAITSPSSSFGFSAGTQITLSGSATDREEGMLAGSRLTWEVVYNHGGVATILLHAAAGANPTLAIPQPADVASAETSTIAISLTATDGHGLHQTVTRTIKPKLVRLTFNTDPAGAAVRVGEVALTGPGSIKTWANSTVRIEAIGGVATTGQPLAFSSWSDSGAAAHSISLPNAGVTLVFTASFSAVNASPYAPIADATVRDSTPNTNLGTSTVLSARSSSPKDRIYLRFNVAGVSGTVTSAKLYLYALTNSVNTPAIYKTANTWSELGITWANRPASVGSALTGATGVSANSWTAFDVATAVTQNGAVSFVIQRDSQTTAQFVAREGGDHAPRLIITTSNDGAAAGSPPERLDGVAYSSSVIDLTWSAPTPPDGVIGYDIERDGALITTIGPSTSYRDEFLRASTTYAYRLRTRTVDGASAWSSVLNVLTPAQTTVLTQPEDGAASVSEDGSFAAGCSTTTNLQVRGGSGRAIESALRFTVAPLPGPVYNAELRIFVSSISAGGESPVLSVFGASTWRGGITWSTRPVRHPIDPFDSIADPTAGTWLTFSVAAAGTFASGDVAFIVASESDSLFCISRSGDTAPQLIIIANQAPASSAVAAAANLTSPTATPVPSTAPAASFPFVDGFESGLSDWSTVKGLTVDSDVVVDSNAAARSRGSGSPESPGPPSFADRPVGDSRTDIWIATSVNVVQSPSESITLVTALGDDGAPIVTVSLNASNELILNELNGGTAVDLGAIAPSQWRRIELHVRLSGHKPVAEAWLDGAFAGSIPLSSDNSPIVAVRIGDGGGIAAFDVAYDNFAIAGSCLGRCPEPATPTATPLATEAATSTSIPSEPSQTPTPEATPTDVPASTIEPELPTPTPSVEAPPEDSPLAEPAE